GVEVFPLIDKTTSFAINHDTDGPRVAMGAIAPIRGIEKPALIIAGICVNRCRVTSAPVTEGLRTDIQSHLDAVAGVVFGAAHLSEIPTGAEKLRSQSGIRRKTAAGQNQSLAVDFRKPIRSFHHNTINPATLICQEARSGGFEANRNSSTLQDAMPHLDQAPTTVFGINEAATVMPAKSTPFRLCCGIENLPLDTHFSHPLHSRIRFVNQQLRQLGHRSP